MDLHTTGKVLKSDFRDFESSLLQQRQVDYSMALAGISFDLLRAITPESQDPMARAKTFARIVKHLCLSNDGKIIKIEFESWGRYLLRLINRNVVGYLDKVKKRRVQIVNQSNELEGKKLAEAAMYFALAKPDDALGHDTSATMHWITLMSEMMKAIAKNDVQGSQKAQLIMLGMMKEFPMAELLTAIAPALEQKPKLSKIDEV